MYEIATRVNDKIAGNRINKLMYAHDTILVTRNKKELQKQVTAWSETMKTQSKYKYKQNRD